MNADPDVPEAAAPASAPTRFGRLPLSSRQIWTVQSPLLGFDALRQFALIAVAGQQPFLWLQALEDPSVAFLLVPAAHFGLEYPGLARPRDVLVMVLLPGRPGEDLRSHRQAPLIFDAARGEFLQSVFEDGEVQGNGRFRPVAAGGAAEVTAALVERLVMVAPVASDAGSDSSGAERAA